VSIEPLSFNIFGIKIDIEQINGIREAIARTYKIVSEGKEASMWKDTEFCKRQIVSLWGGIMQTLSAISEREIPTGIEKFQQGDRGYDELRRRLNVDRDNQDFLNVFGKQLMRDQVIGQILGELSEMNVERGSIRIRYRDRLADRTMEARIEIGKMLKQIKKESRKIETALKHFVEWAKENKRPLITCSLAAGAILTSIVAISFIGGSMVPLIGVKLFILATLSIVCTIYEIYGTFDTLNDVKSALSRRVGLHFREV
jgi:hypothetical protein